MAKILATFGSGGANINPGGANNPESLATVLRDMADDFETLRTQHNALLTDVTAIRTKFVATLGKLDADAGVTDTNYNALEAPAALTAASIASVKTTKG